MDEKERQVLSFKASSEELESIDAAARAEGLTRADYLRRRVLGAPKAAALTGTPDLERLLRHIVYITSRTHMAVYSIAEVTGALAVSQLQSIYDRSVEHGVDYLAKLDEAMTMAEAKAAAHQKPEKPSQTA